MTTDAYWLHSCIRTLSLQGWWDTCKNGNYPPCRRRTRISYSQRSVSLSSLFTHSSGSAIHCSKSDGLRGMNRVMSNCTAFLTNSSESAGTTDNWVFIWGVKDQNRTIFIRSAISPGMRGPPWKALLEKHHPLHKKAERVHGFIGICQAKVNQVRGRMSIHTTN